MRTTNAAPAPSGIGDERHSVDELTEHDASDGTERSGSAEPAETWVRICGLVDCWEPARRGRWGWSRYCSEGHASEGHRAALDAYHARRRQERPVTYWAVHRWLRRVRGPAKDHMCACGAPAHSWAYLHTDPDELIAASGHVKGFPYSADPHHYAPLCGACHIALDRARARARRGVG